MEEKMKSSTKLRNLRLLIGMGLMIAAFGSAVIDAAYAGVICEGCQKGGRNYGAPCCHGK
jgi:hypothetical protein